MGGLFEIPHLLIILIIALLLFGKRLPEVSRSLGRGLREFQKGMRGIEDELTREMTSEPAKPAPPAQASQPTAQVPPALPTPPASPPPVPGPPVSSS